MVFLGLAGGTGRCYEADAQRGREEVAKEFHERVPGLVSMTCLCNRHARAVSGRLPEGLDLTELRRVSTWVVHGGSDDKAPLADAQAAVALLRLQGAPVNLTVYPSADHFISEQAFGDASLLSWIVQRHRGPLRAVA